MFTSQTDEAQHRDWDHFLLDQLKLDEHFVHHDMSHVTVLQNALMGENYFFITVSGALYALGDNEHSILGLGHSQPVKDRPVRVDLGEHKTVEVVHCIDRVLVLTSDGHIFAWGRNDRLCFGGGVTLAWLTKPEVVAKGNNIKKIYIGGNHQGYLDDEGMLFTWGDNSQGQLGLGAFGLVGRVPQAVHYSVTKAAFGYEHCVAINDIGQLRSWGANSWGQLGLGHFLSQCTPRQVIINFFRFIDVSAYANHTLVVTEHNQLWGFGENGQFELAVEVKNQRGKVTTVATCIDTPVRVRRQPPREAMQRRRMFNEPPRDEFIEEQNRERYYQRFDNKVVAIECRQNCTMALALDEHDAPYVVYWEPSETLKIWQCLSVDSFSALQPFWPGCGEMTSMLRFVKDRPRTPARQDSTSMQHSTTRTKP